MSGLAFAIVTPSYEADFARCQLLCESIDALAEGAFNHYILVADHDLAQFRTLAGPRRRVIPDSELLPRWMKAVKRPFDRKRRHMWISSDLRRQIRPLSGWHVQQLRKLALPKIVDEPLIVMADSDSVFVKPFGAASFLRGDLVRLYRRPGAISGAPSQQYDHEAWTRVAARVLGLPEPVFPADDYIHNLICWRRENAQAMLARIEEVNGAPVEQVLGRVGTFSEYQIYGAFASGPAAMAGHFATSDVLCHTYWTGGSLDDAGLGAFVARLEPHQIAIGIQSFTATPVELLRGIFRRGLVATSHM